MNKKSENLNNLEVSINALEKKASDINERIKKHSKSLNINKIKNKNESKDTDYYEAPNVNKSLEIKDNIDNLNILELENKLKKELLELKSKQKILSGVLYAMVIIFISLIILAIEMNFIKYI